MVPYVCGTKLHNLNDPGYSATRETFTSGTCIAIEYTVSLQVLPEKIFLGVL